MTTTIIGLGLMGGSMALELRKSGWAEHFIGVEVNPKHAKKAIELGIVDETMDLKAAVGKADLVILAIPVNATQHLVNSILDDLREDAILIDVGSTKSGICDAARNHVKRGNFVACHPLAGTENTGPEAAIYDLFTSKVNIICEQESSYPWAFERIDGLFSEVLKMRNAYMNPVEHDRHIAYVSHLSHISSFTLGLTVLDIEKDEKHIFNMASTGFASTVRLAKSSPKMWTPIFEENAKNVSEALAAYIEQLQDFKNMIDNGDFETIYERIEEANGIRRILDGIELKKIVLL
jgi:prephenate dehydrogenase